MASNSRTGQDEPPPYVEHPPTVSPKAEVLPEYSVHPVVAPLTLDDQLGRPKRREYFLKRRFALIILAVLVVVGIVTGYLIYKRKKAEKSQDSPSPILALAACECDLGTFVVYQSNDSWADGFYLTGGVQETRNNSFHWTFENEPINIRNESASVKGPNRQTNITTVCRVDTDNTIWIHVFYISGIFNISEAIIHIPSLSSKPELQHVTQLARVQDAPSISAIYHTTLGIRLYYLAFPTTQPDVGSKQTMLTEMSWTKLTGWRVLNQTLSNADDPGAALAVCVLDGSRLKQRGDTTAIQKDTIHVFYSNTKENIEYMKWSSALGWSNVYELWSDGNKPAHKITNMAAILPTYSYNQPMIFYVSSNKLHQITKAGDFDYFWTQTLDNVPDATQHPPLIAAATNATSWNHEYDTSFLETPKTHLFYVSNSRGWNRFFHISHIVTTYLWDKKMTGPEVNMEYLLLKASN